MRSFILRVAAVALALAGTTGAAQATWVTGDTGAASFTGGGVTATVDYAVWQNPTSGTGHQSTLLGELNAATGSSQYTASNNPFGATASTPATTYLYFYEVANPSSNKSNVHLSELDLGTDTSKVVYAGTALSSATNNVFSSTGSTPTFTTSASAKQWSYSGDNGNPPIDFDSGGQNNLMTGQNTTLMIIASNGKPGFEPGSVTASNTTGSNPTGSLPVPTPEPGTIALLGLTLPIFGWGYIRRLRQNRAVVAAAAQ